MLCPFTPLRVWMEIALRNKSGTWFGSIVGIRVGILGFGVGKGMFVPSGIVNVGGGDMPSSVGMVPPTISSVGRASI
jgi:hypothetical protein